jgi:hypothetical protein
VSPIRAILATLAVALLVVSAASPAQAATITIGSPLTADFSMAVIGYPGPETVANLALPEPGALAMSPVEGTIVRWRVLYTTGGPFRLRVLAPNPDGTYTGVGTSGPQTSATTALQSFPTSLPIKAGQTIGLDNTHDLEGGDQLGAIQSAPAVFAAWNPALADGSSRAPKVFTGEEKEEVLGAEVAFNADVVARPGVDLMSPATGPISGGTAVGIAGHDLGGATGVTFGAVPAASFAVLSDGLVTATAPAGTGIVDVSVTTAGGTSAVVPADRFAYEACVVPRIAGRKLQAARKSLAAARCKLGKIRGKGKKVIKQSRKAGTILDPGAAVSVKLGPPPRRRGPRHR